jgi:hypothetical protein
MFTVFWMQHCLAWLNCDDGISEDPFGYIIIIIIIIIICLED